MGHAKASKWDGEDPCHLEEQTTRKASRRQKSKLDGARLKVESNVSAELGFHHPRLRHRHRSGKSASLKCSTRREELFTGVGIEPHLPGFRPSCLPSRVRHAILERKKTGLR